MSIIEELKMNDLKQLIETKIGKSDFISVYCNENEFKNVEQGAFYCALVPTDKLDVYLNDYGWDLHIGDGRPGFCYYWAEGEEIAEYNRFSEDEVEPLVYYRSFHGVKKSYIEISEEFRLYFNLYEDYKTPTTKTYIFIDDNGDEEEVIIIEENEVRIKLKLLKEYLAARKLSLLLFFEFMRFSHENLATLGIEGIDETIKRDDIIYHHLIRSVNIGGKRIQSWLLGKKAIHGAKDFKPQLLDKTKKYEEFIIGTDDEGNEIKYTSNEDNLSDYFGKNPGCPHYLTPVFFKKEVLDKYYNNPDKYVVEDGLIRCCGLWSLRIDNNHPKYVMVYLGDLGHLEQKEQMYWKSFNISYDGGISRVAWERDFEAKFTDPEQPDLYFKMKYELFQKKWEKKYGWNLFKPLSQDDSHHFKSLHIPLSNNRKEFDEQVLSLVKIIIDSLNEKELSDGIDITKSNPKGIDKLEAFLQSKNLRPDPDKMIKFLRNLQTLRSSSIAHRKSKNNKDYQKVQSYFKLNERTLIEVFEDILIKTIWIFNTLEKYLLD